MVFDIIKHGEL